MEPTTVTPQQPDQKPTVGKAVLVTFFGGAHVLRSAVAHVLAVSTYATDLTTEDGLPSISVAYPAEPIDALKLASPRWQDAYIRKSGVVHFSHPLAKAGKVSIVWGHPVQEGELPTLIQPEGDGQNPIFTREQLPEQTQPDMSQVAAVQSGRAPEGVSVSPLTSDAISPTTAPETPTEAHTEPEEKS
jgi:hypothetical protein